MKTKLFLFMFLSLLGMSSAWAHPHHSLYETGFGAGFLHPLNGVDHIAVMLAIGIWAMRRSYGWVLPIGFMAAMVIGALSVDTVSFSYVDWMVMGSVAVIVMAAYRNLGLVPGLGLVAIAGFFHGFAHAQEMPGHLSLNDFSVGFLVSTALLHGMGMTGAYLRKRYSQRSWISNQV